MISDDEIERVDAAADAAAARCEFQLTYARSSVPREFARGMLTGPNIPNAYGPGTAAGEWCDSTTDGVVDTDPESWIDRYAGYALNEAVHEALEWMRVDGRPWLDPHGPNELDIYAEVNELCTRLAAIRKNRTEAAAQ